MRFQKLVKILITIKNSLKFVQKFRHNKNFTAINSKNLILVKSCKFSQSQTAIAMLIAIINQSQSMIVSINYFPKLLGNYARLNIEVQIDFYRLDRSQWRKFSNYMFDIGQQERKEVECKRKQKCFNAAHCFFAQFVFGFWARKIIIHHLEQKSVNLFKNSRI